MLPTPRPKRRHCAPGTRRLSQLTTARKAALQPGMRNAQPASAQNRTPAGYTPRSTRLPLHARPHASRVRATLSPPATARKTPQPVGYAPRSARPHCAQDRTPAGQAQRSARPHCAQNRTAGRARAASARPPLRAKPHSPSGIRHALPAAGDVKTSQSRLT